MDPSQVIEAAKVADTLGVVGAMVLTAIATTIVWGLIGLRLWRLFTDERDAHRETGKAWRASDLKKEEFLDKLEETIREGNTADGQRALQMMAMVPLVENLNRSHIALDLRLASIERLLERTRR